MPKKYDLRIALRAPGDYDEDKWYVIGEMDIEVAVKQTTDCMVLHAAKGMEIRDFKISENDGG